jgi:hypothetical protein
MTTPLPTKRLFEGGSDPQTRAIWTYIELLRRIYTGLADAETYDSGIYYSGLIAPPKEEVTCFDDVDMDYLFELLSVVDMELFTWSKLGDDEIDDDEKQDWRVYEIVAR